MLTSRQRFLLDYLLDVTRDLVTRGTLRRATGQTILSIFKSEPRVVLSEVSEDVVAVFKELGIGMAKSKFVNDLFGAAGGWLTDKLADAIAGKMRR